MCKDYLQFASIAALRNFHPDVFDRGHIVKSRHTITRNRPVMGTAAFVRAGAMKSPGTCGAVTHPAFPSSQPWVGRNDSQMHPGEARV